MTKRFRTQANSLINAIITRFKMDDAYVTVKLDETEEVITITFVSPADVRVQLNAEEYSVQRRTGTVDAPRWQQVTGGFGPLVARLDLLNSLEAEGL